MYCDYFYQSLNKAPLRQTKTTPDVTRTSYAYDSKALQQQHAFTADYRKSIGIHNMTVLLGGELFDDNKFVFTTPVMRYGPSGYACLTCSNFAAYRALTRYIE